MIPHVVTVLILFILSQVVKVLNEYERGVIFRLGRLIPSKGPGIILLIPFIDKLQRMSLRLETLDVPPQDVITKDNVSIKGKKGKGNPRRWRISGLSKTFRGGCNHFKRSRCLAITLPANTF